MEGSGDLCAPGREVKGRAQEPPCWVFLKGLMAWTPDLALQSQRSTLCRVGVLGEEQRAQHLGTAWPPRWAAQKATHLEPLSCERLLGTHDRPGLWCGGSCS